MVKLKKIAFLFIAIALSGHLCFSQQYNFLHYDIEDGLVQSQVNEMGQDNSGRLWIATVGGLSYFDGSEFTNYTKAEGLNSSTILSVLSINNKTTFIGGTSGLSILNNQRINHFKYPNYLNSVIHHLVLDEKKVLWGLNGLTLFSYEKNLIANKFILNKGELISTLTTNSKNELMAYIIGKGLVIRKKGRWVTLGNLNEDNPTVFKILESNINKDEYILFTTTKIYILKNGKIEDFKFLGLEKVRKPYLDILKDDDSNFWIGTNLGAYRLSESGLIHFTEKTGFTNNAITKIFLDSNRQIWFGSNGAGIFKFGGDAFKSFFQNSEIINPVINKIARDENGNIYFISGGKLYRFNDSKIIELKLPNNIPITFIYSDASNHLWLHSIGNGIYQLKNGSFKDYAKTTIANKIPYFVFSMLKTPQNEFYVGMDNGCYYFSNNKLQQINFTKGITGSLIEIGKDSILAATRTEIYMINGFKKNKSFQIKQLENKEVLCMLNYKNYVWFGTLNEGLYLWNKKNKEIKSFTRKNGLSSNDIYSLSLDKNGLLWVGTGKGINQFKISTIKEDITPYQNFNYPKLIVETNQNSIFNIDDKMWVGTAKGLFSYTTIPIKNRFCLPNVEIRSIRIYTTTNTGQQDDLKILNKDTTETINLNSNQNKLTINFAGIHLKNAEELSYQYKLSGIDTDYSSPQKYKQVVYSSLIPGEYIFNVFAINNAGQKSEIKKLYITIAPSFYQTIWFKLLILTLIILLIVFIQYFITRLRIIEQRKIERLRLIEQDKIRIQTAEDFHDDIGNKLTRISILSDILESQLTNVSTNQKNIFNQIKQNVNTLYTGTKDILWALDPQSDNFYEIISYLKGFGIDFLEETDISFSVEGLNDNLRRIVLPMQYSRNITLMIKELINNAAKYANCTKIILKVYLINDLVTISLIDNGKGFNYEEVSNGRGLNNLKSRCERISAQLDIKSNNEDGTIVTINFKISHIKTK